MNLKLINVIDLNTEYFGVWGEARVPGGNQRRRAVATWTTTLTCCPDFFLRVCVYVVHMEDVHHIHDGIIIIKA